VEEKNIKEILEVILDRVGGSDVFWIIEGSANLKIHGIDVSVQDLDITTNDEGIEFFRDNLKKFIVKDFFSEKINGPSLICNICGFEVEINSYGDRKFDVFVKIEKVLWRDLRLPILSLDDTKKFYESIGRKDEVNLISSYLDE